MRILSWRIIRLLMGTLDSRLEIPKHGLSVNCFRLRV